MKDPKVIYESVPGNRLNRMGMVGKKYKMLTVLDIVGTINGLINCLCVCDCGNKIIKPCNFVKKGAVVSCGCKRTSWSHGLSKTPIHNVWLSMKSRCSLTSDNATKIYKMYAGRGIRVCKRWHKFENFYADMHKTYKDGLTLDRIDVNKGYSPKNCRWADYFTQANNTRRNVYLEYDGLRKTVSEWSRVYGIRPNRIGARLKLGWTIKDAITTPIKKEYIRCKTN